MSQYTLKITVLPNGKTRRCRDRNNKQQQNPPAGAKKTE